MRIAPSVTPPRLHVVPARSGAAARQDARAAVPAPDAGWGWLKGWFDGSPAEQGLSDVSGARDWRPGARTLSGAQANDVVTDTYAGLDTEMSAYMGAPAAPNWMTFGKYASREAGGQILRLEETLKVLCRLDTDSLVDAMQDLLANPGRLGEQGLALARLSRTPQAFLNNTWKIRNALVHGNTGVYADVAPAYRVFLDAVRAGGDGLSALEAAGFGRAPRDPQGFLLTAFRAYAQARALGAAAAASADPIEKAKLLARRQALAHEGNVWIGVHEQMVVLQGPAVFGDPGVATLLRALTPKMTLTDARGTHALLPNGGNWADFAERMGFADAPAGTPGALKVRDHAGVLHHYVANPDAGRREGSIVKYFEEGLPREAAAVLIAHAPKPLPDMYSDGNDMGRWLGWALSLPGRLWGWVGDRLRPHQRQVPAVARRIAGP